MRNPGLVPFFDPECAVRRFALSLLCIVAVAGLARAAEYVVVAYDRETKILTMKSGDAEIAAKLTTATKVKVLDADGKVLEKLGRVETLEKLLASARDAKGRKLEATIADGIVTEVVIRPAK